MENNKAYIKQRIEELLKAHDIHHMKKKFKRDILKLEVFKIEFCNVYKNVISFDRDEESKSFNNELNFNHETRNKEIEKTETNPTTKHNYRVTSLTPDIKNRQNVIHKVIKETKKMNISTLDKMIAHDRPITPININKNFKLEINKVDYSTTPNKTSRNYNIITHSKPHHEPEIKIKPDTITQEKNLKSNLKKHDNVPKPPIKEQTKEKLRKDEESENIKMENKRRENDNNMKDKSINVVEKEEDSKDDKIDKKTKKDKTHKHKHKHKKHKVVENKESEKSKFDEEKDNQSETIKTLEDEDQKVIAKSLIVEKNHNQSINEKSMILEENHNQTINEKSIILEENPIQKIKEKSQNYEENNNKTEIVKIKINEENKSTAGKLNLNDENPQIESFKSNSCLKDELEVVKTDKINENINNNENVSTSIQIPDGKEEKTDNSKYTLPANNTKLEVKEFKEEKRTSIIDRSVNNKRLSMNKDSLIVKEKKNEILSFHQKETNDSQRNYITSSQNEHNEKKNEKLSDQSQITESKRKSISKILCDSQIQDKKTDKTPDRQILGESKRQSMNKLLNDLQEKKTVKTPTREEIKPQIIKKGPQEDSLEVKNTINSSHIPSAQSRKIDNFIEEKKKMETIETIALSKENTREVPKQEMVSNEMHQFASNVVGKTSNSNSKLNRFAKIDMSFNFNKALFLTAIKNYLPLPQRISILLNVKNLSLAKEDVIRALLIEYEEKNKSNQALISKYEKVNLAINKDAVVDNQVNKVFSPSKTAINGLNFITKEEEIILIKKEYPNEVLNIFRAIYIVINENYSGLPGNKIIDNLINSVIPKRKLENLKSIFLNLIPSSLSVFTQFQYEKLIKLLSDNPKLLNSSELLKLSRSVSYMTFILKDIFDFVNMKTPDGTLVYLVRTSRKTQNDLIGKIENLKKALNTI